MLPGCREGFGWSLRLGSVSSDVVPYQNVEWKHISHTKTLPFRNTGEQQRIKIDVRSECGLRSRMRTRAHRGIFNSLPLQHARLSLPGYFISSCPSDFNQFTALLFVPKSRTLHSTGALVIITYLGNVCSKLTNAWNWKPVF